jgi:hypothetical protein
MIDRHERRSRLLLGLLPLVFALLLAACAQSGGGPWPRGYDPYHYRQPFQAGT